MSSSGPNPNAFLYGGSPIISTPQAQVNSVTAINPLDFKMTYTTDPAPSRAHLTLPLSKPMHQYTEAELHGLVTELEKDGWLAQEETIARAVDQAYMAWKGERGAAGPHPRYTTHTVPANTVSFVPGASPAMVSNHKTISVHIPASIPEPYVRAFIERSVRDQIEEE